MQAGHYSSLLPELFRHKTTKVRLFQPQVMLLDFHGTISERRWEDRVIFPYVRRALGRYLRDNLASEPVQRCLAGLRNESFEQRFRNRYEDAPVIEDQSEAEALEPGQLAQQLEEFVQWQMANRRETRETQIIERLVWQDGFRQRQLATPIYEDALPCVQDWRERLNLSMYIISSLDSETLKLLLENTDRGNLHQYLSGYVSSKRIGDKLISDTYRQFYERTVSKECQQRLLAANKSASSKARPAAAGAAAPSTNSSSPAPPPSAVNSANGGKSPPPSSPGASSLENNSNSNSNSRSNKSAGSLKSPRSSSSTGSSSGEISPKPILFLTDSGQEAKAASLVADGAAFECLLVNRPGNKRIRTYYLSQFQYVDKFDDIEFIQ